jgi:hypothetical protein
LSKVSRSFLVCSVKFRDSILGNSVSFLVLSKPSFSNDHLARSYDACVRLDILNGASSCGGSDFWNATRIVWYRLVPMFPRTPLANDNEINIGRTENMK